MDKILDEMEYKIFLGTCEYQSQRDTIITNIKTYNEIPPINERKCNTHIKYHSNGYFIQLSWATNLKFLLLDRDFKISKIKLALFTNLATLVLPIKFMSDRQLLNLPPNLKTLIVDCRLSFTSQDVISMRLDNLPILLKKIVFYIRDFKYYSDDVSPHKILKEYLMKSKYSFNCRICICKFGSDTYKTIEESFL